MPRAVLLTAAAAVALWLAPTALADSWLPHPPDAEWVYEWSNSVYSTTPTREKVTVKSQNGPLFTLAWTTVDQGNAPEAVTSRGEMAFVDETYGVKVLTWTSDAPPVRFPVLCAAVPSCPNSLASTWYQLIWGTRDPVLWSPLLQGTTWNALGGGGFDVTSASRYLGTEQVSVPAFPTPVSAAKIRSDVVQAGALGDPYGTGTRTVWWVYGVGPVKLTIEHAGAAAPVTISTLVATNQTPEAAPPDTRWLPMVAGRKQRYRWTNTRHMRRASVQEVETTQVANGSARFDVKHVAGPIRVAGRYLLTTRGDGVTAISTRTESQSLVRFPALGPRSRPRAERRRFVTPLDLMLYGFNPLLPAHPAAGDAWSAKVPSRDFSTYGVVGTTKVLGLRTVEVAKRRYRALAVESRLTQKGFPFGSGTRTSYFVAGTGLVKLVFRHGDRSVSTVELVR